MRACRFDRPVRFFRGQDMKITQIDLVALDRIRVKITALRADTEKAFPEYKASEWQYMYSVADKGITVGRINRLVKLGKLESKPSDGFGSSIRVV